MRIAAPADVEFMVRRGWNFGELMAMSNAEFGFWLDTAAEAAKAEHEAANA